jgi:hypothetical protein
MKLTLGKLVGMQAAMAALAQIKLPAKASYRIAKNTRLIQQEMAAFEEARLGAAKEFGTLHPDGTKYSFEPEKLTLFNAAMEAVAKEEVEIALMVVPLPELGDIQIEPAILADLDIIIPEEAPPVPPVPAP